MSIGSLHIEHISPDSKHCLLDLSAGVSSRDERSEATLQRHHFASIQDIKNLERKVGIQILCTVMLTLLTLGVMA